MFEVNVYIETSHKSLKQKTGWYFVILEYQTAKGPATFERMNKVEEVTGNRLELSALEAALEKLSKPCDINLYTESRYLNNAITQHWISRWQQSDFKTAKRQEVKNADLWKKVSDKIAPHFVNMRFAEHHSYKKIMGFNLKQIEEKERKDK
jgi:ribonuclease HI